MRVCLEPKDLIGKTISTVHFTDHQLVLGFGSSGYIHIESHTDWDERACIQEGEDLTEKQQHELGLLTAEESAEYLRIQAEKERLAEEERKRTAEQRLADQRQVEINEFFTLSALIKRHPDLARSIIDGTGGTDYTGGPIRKATVEEIAVMVSGELPVEKQRFPREVR